MCCAKQAAFFLWQKWKNIGDKAIKSDIIGKNCKGLAL